MRGLNKLYWIKKEIAQIESQIDEITLLKASAVSATPGGNGGSSPVENAVIKLDKLHDRLRKKIGEYATERERIENIIDGIQDDEVRVIARMRFVDNMEYQKIGEALYIDRTTAYKKLKNYVDGMKEG